MPKLQSNTVSYLNSLSFGGSLYKPRNRVSRVTRVSSYREIYYRGKEAFYERLVLLELKALKVLPFFLSLSLYPSFSLSRSVKISVSLLNSMLIQSMKILKADAVAAQRPNGKTSF